MTETDKTWLSSQARDDEWEKVSKQMQSFEKLTYNTVQIGQLASARKLKIR